MSILVAIQSTESILIAASYAFVQLRRAEILVSCCMELPSSTMCACQAPTNARTVATPGIFAHVVCFDSYEYTYQIGAKDVTKPGHWQSARV